MKGLGATLGLMAGEMTRKAEIIGPAQVRIGLRQDDIVMESHARQDHPPMRGVDRGVAKERNMMMGVRHSKSSGGEGETIDASRGTSCQSL
jgi:hypothetical protein